MSKGFLESAGMMLAISEAGNSGSSKTASAAVYRREEKRRKHRKVNSGL
jgi:hypothetical protein